uniref:Beta-1,3-glucosyltransferase n=1 Tax=Panagrolaimus sp. PS1159 TaxID=55785 RepID=A0AC35FEI8_9BILA
MGGWTIWPLFRKLPINSFDWFLFIEPYTKVDVKRLIGFLENHNKDELLFFGYGLTDTDPVIIHHFYGYDKPEKLKYPDFGAGVVFSQALLLKLLQVTSTEQSATAFAIDAKFELAKIVEEFASTPLTTDIGFCISPAPECFIWFEEPEYPKNTTHCGKGITNDNTFIGIKTCSKFHKSRVLISKRTWAKEGKYVEFFSDIPDFYIPTIDLGIPNTEKGHCAKTFGILKHALEHDELNEVSWFIIGDDDSIISISRLYKLLNCLPKVSKLIIGERYGYGFTFDGLGGYNYPTGGAGMIFSRSAARALISFCDCPADDSPDDMIIGMCARRLSIDIIHSAAFHQARPIDYSPDYLKRQKPISFHKHEEIDPYEVYANLLYERDEFLENQKQAKWISQHSIPKSQTHNEL